MKTTELKKVNDQIIIFVLHGLGGIAWARKRFVREVSKNLPYNVKFILLQAKIIRFTFLEKYPLPLFLTGWYNIKSRKDLEHGENDHGLLATIKEIESLIASEVKRGIPSTNIFLLGFSQGGSVVLSMALVSRYQLGGIIGLATFLPYHKVLVKHETPFNKETPIFMWHGENDRIVPEERGRESAQFLENKGYQIKYRSLPNLGHYGITYQLKEEITVCLSHFFTLYHFQANKQVHEPEIEIIKMDKNSSWPEVIGTIVSVPALLYSFIFARKKLSSSPPPQLKS